VQYININRHLSSVSYVGITGTGLDRNVVAGYSFLVNNFHERDEIFCFGFSRGAYTARSIAGLVSELGILPKGALPDLAEFYNRYRIRHEDMKSWKTYLEKKEREYLCRGYGSICDAKIKICGAWDTVGALGIPQTSYFNPFNGEHRFHNPTLSESEFHTALLP
jgi:uncharacterized protein (DUF2235 family)